MCKPVFDLATDPWFTHNNTSFSTRDLSITHRVEGFGLAFQPSGTAFQRSGIGKIESRLRCVTDFELIHLARAFKCQVGDLFPEGGESLI